MTAQAIAILDLLHHGYHPPAPGHPDHDRHMAEWVRRYHRRRAAADRMLGAIAAVEAVADDDLSASIADPPTPQRALPRQSGPIRP
jgi:hypothetical protein